MWLLAIKPAFTSSTYMDCTGGIIVGQLAGGQGFKSGSVHTTCLAELNHMMSRGNDMLIIQNAQ